VLAAQVENRFYANAAIKVMVEIQKGEIGIHVFSPF
jgi:hypothetical protein